MKSLYETKLKMVFNLYPFAIKHIPSSIIPGLFIINLIDNFIQI